MILFELQEKYYDPIKRFVNFHIKDQWVTEDIVQETFLKAHKNFETLNDKSKAKTWLYKIAWNLCLNYFKKAKKDHAISSNQIDHQPDKINILQQMEQNEMNSCIQDKIKQLPDKLKLVLSLYDIERMSHKEISEILNITVETTKTRLHRARKALKIIFEKECTFQRDSRNIFVCVPKGDDFIRD